MMYICLCLCVDMKHSNYKLFQTDLESQERCRHIAIIFQIVGYLDCANNKKYMETPEERMFYFVCGALLHYLLGEMSQLIGGVHNKPYYFLQFNETEEGRKRRMKAIRNVSQFKSILESDGMFNLRDAVANCPYYVLHKGRSGGLVGEGGFEGMFEGIRLISVITCIASIFMPIIMRVAYSTTCDEGSENDICNTTERISLYAYHI